MDDHMNEIIERSVRKRPLESSNVSNEFAVKKPALVNPLQETNRLIPQSIPVKTEENSKQKEKKKEITSCQQIIDEKDRNNPIYFSQYAQRIVNHWLKVEEKFCCSPNYLDGNNEIKPYMRETMIDWIIDVHNKLSKRRETLYLCVNIIDRYVSTVLREKTDIITRGTYQLVGVAAYFIASKYEEIAYPEIATLLDCADNCYNEADVKEMEIKIVNTLQYDLTVPTTNKFLERFLHLTNNQNLRYMCYYICDRMLQSLSMLQWKPSVQAAAALYLGRKYLSYNISWDEMCEEFTGVKKSTLLPCAVAIHEIINNPNRLETCNKKYKSTRFNQIYYCIPGKAPRK